MRYAMLIALFSGTAFASPKPYDFAALAGSETLLVLDLLQSLDIKAHAGLHEMNPIYGSHPSDSRYLTMFAIYGLTDAVAWSLLPDRWRWVAPCLVIGVEGPTVIRNARFGLRAHF